MQIKSISLENFKGQNETYGLEKANLFVGPYGSGKSSVQQAINFLISGVLSDGNTVRKTPEEIFKLASADTMNVTIDTDSGSYMRGIKRTVKKSLEGDDIKFSRSADVSNKFGEKTATELSNRIIADFGIDPSVLNFSEFAKLSAAEQKKYIFSLYPPNKEEWTKEKIELFLTEKLGEYATDASEIIEQVAIKCVDGSVNAATEFVTSKFNEYNAQKKKDEVALQNLTQIRQECQESVKGLAVAEKKRDEYNERSATLAAEVEKSNQNNKSIEEDQRKLEKLTSELSVFTNKIDTTEKQIASLDELLETLRTEIVEFDSTNLDTQLSVKELELQKHVQNFRNKDAAKEAIEKERAVIFESYIEQDKLVVKSLDAVVKSQNIVNTLSKTLETICKFDGSCPVNCNIKCNTDMRPAIIELEAEIERNKDLLSELTADHKTKGEKLDSLVSELKQYEDDIDDVKQTLEGIESVCDGLDNEIELIKRKIENDKTEINNKNTLKISEINVATSKRETAIETLNDTRHNLNTKQSEIDDLNAKETHVIDIELLQTEMAAIKGHVEDLNNQIKAKVEARTNLENLAKKEQDAQENLSSWQTYKFLKEAIGSKGLAGKMIIDAITPMITGVQENLDALINGAAFYIDTENFNFGWEKDGHKRSYETLSNGETLILTTAIVIEFMQKTCKTKILLVDNLNDVDEASASKVIEGITKLQHKYDLSIMASNQQSAGKGLENLKVFEL